MKKVVNVVLLTSAFLSAHAGARVIYGEDGRKEVSEAKAIHQKLALSTPSMVAVESIGAIGKDGSIDLLQTSFQDWIGAQGEPGAPSKFMSLIKRAKENAEISKMAFCPGERFVDQPNPGMCSGFLIAPDLIVTAGHCAEVPKACEGYKWVFDFKVDEDGSAGLGVNPDNIYSCKKIITKSLNMELATDFAIIQLDRKVIGREPLEIRYTGSVGSEAAIVVIGNPSGLPLKVTEGAKVRTNTHSMYFTANLDTFQGNSGSAVFDAETNIVEGILVRGEEDFTFNAPKMCLEANKCADDACRGEDVTRINSIPEIAFKKLLDKAAVKGDTLTLNVILSFNTWVDFYGKDGQSALIKAAAVGMKKSLVILLARGADVNLSDANGNTALHHLAQSKCADASAALDTLITAKADLNARNNDGMTAMMLAEASGNVLTMMLLMQAGAL
ncbi:MAG TPA: trypsin-like peptidase domain-containing protein [Bacteriovoracaceae bacterium]|nr:trypsin-like peptidase domain-containing protein [Bacteriovoracaceae bacterium]